MTETVTLSGTNSMIGWRHQIPVALAILVQHQILMADRLPASKECFSHRAHSEASKKLWMGKGVADYPILVIPSPVMVDLSRSVTLCDDDDDASGMPMNLRHSTRPGMHTKAKESTRTIPCKDISPNKTGVKNPMRFLMTDDTSPGKHLTFNTVISLTPLWRAPLQVI